MIKTERLALVALTNEMKVAFAQSREAFAGLIGASLPEGWPQFPEAFIPRASAEEPYPFQDLLFIDASGRQLIGNGGFVAPPNADGETEIGYEIAPAHWNKGYATEAVRAMISTAFVHGAASIIAHSLAERNASNAVLEKAGMRLVAELPNDEVGAVWRYRVARDLTQLTPSST